MKTAYFLTLLLVVLAAPLNAADGLTGALQQGLFEEEANRNLDKAIEAYQSLVTQFDKDRQIGATAVFRLGECYRKLGRTNEAILQYERIVREFPDQATLATLSRQNLTGLGKGPIGAVSSKTQDGEVSGLAMMFDEGVEIRRLQSLLKTSPDLLNSTTGGNPRTPLQSASENGQLRVAQFLLESGADVNAGAGRKPLNLAAAAGHKALVELLLSRGAPVDGSKTEECTPLHSAVAANRRSVVETLLAAKASINAQARENNGRISRGDTPLLVAVKIGDDSLINLLLKSGASIAVENEVHESPLGMAIRANDLELATLLIKSGANPNSPAPTLPLAMAIDRANVNMVKLLLEAGADANALLTEQSVPLLFKVIEKEDLASDEIAALMIKAGAKVDATAILRTVQGKQMIDGGNSGRTVRPLHYASIMGRTNQVNVLLQNGADANARTSDGSSSLDLVASSRLVGLVEALIAHGAKVNDRNPEGTTPLWKATINLNLAVAKVLLEAGADPNVIDNSGRTLLEAVPSSGSADTRSADMIALLKRFGARDDFPRWNQIRYARGAEKPSRWWSSDPQNFWEARSSLLELIASTKPTFPDLTKVRILRPQRDGGPAKVIPVNVEELIAAEDRTRDPWLEWGDVVEIPMLDHALSATWPGFENEKVEKLVRILQRRVTLICAGKTNQVQLVSQRLNPDSTSIVYVNGLLSRLVVDSGLLRTSSDLSRIILRRMDPKTKAMAQIAIDGRGWVTQKNLPQGFAPQPAPPQPLVPVPVADNRPASAIKDVWLRDGDVIEVPEKTER